MVAGAASGFRRGEYELRGNMRSERRDTRQLALSPRLSSQPTRKVASFKHLDREGDLVVEGDATAARAGNTARESPSQASPSGSTLNPREAMPCPVRTCSCNSPSSGSEIKARIMANIITQCWDSPVARLRGRGVQPSAALPLIIAIVDSNIACPRGAIREHCSRARRKYCCD